MGRFKSGRTLTHEAFAGLHKWCAMAGDKAGAPTLIYAGDEAYQHKGINVLGWRECGLCLNENTENGVDPANLKT